MIEKINERVSVNASYLRDSGEIIIHKIRWNGRTYKITKLGYHHKTRAGRNIFHIFHVTDGSLAFKLQLDTEFLKWSCLEVSDGSPN